MAYFWAPGVQLNLGPAVAGDLIVGRADGAFDRLAVGSNGQILSVVGGVVTWGEGPLTTVGDLLIGATGAAPTRLAVGSNGQILSVVGGVVTWGEGPLTTAGDLLIGATGAAPTRLAVGSNGQILNVSAGVIRWGNTIDLGGLTITSGSLIIGAIPSTIGNIRLPAASSIYFRNAANTADNRFLTIDGSDNLIIGSTAVLFLEQPVQIDGASLTFSTAASIIIPGATSFSIRNAANNADNLIILDAGGATFRAGITHGSATLMTTTVALTNNAGVAAGTLGNAPVAGNPVKWIVINDNGTVRSIPTW